MIDRDEVASAAKRIAPFIRCTPVLDIDGGALGLEMDVTLKLELMQHTGSFKPRGAFNGLLSQEVPPAGVVAASGGNHGAAVAYATSVLGVPARIFVPEIAGPAKIALIRSTGADLEVVEGVYANAAHAANAYQAETGALSIHAYDAPGTVAGQGTVGLEIAKQMDEVDTVLVAVGGGGLIAGITSWFAGRADVVAVEPETAPTLSRALEDGPEVEVEVSGVAANSLGARKIGGIAYETCRQNNVQSVLVSDQAIVEAQRRLWQACRVLAEPGGVTALAALTSGVWRPAPGSRVCVVICGGNADVPFERAG